MIYMSRDPLPENPTMEDFEKLNWIEVGEGEITPVQDVAVKTDKFFTRGDIDFYPPQIKNPA